MTAIWYYVDRAHTRQGPVEPEALAQAVARGEVDDTSLVWREGMDQWSPLAAYRSELGLPPGAGMPPSPPSSQPTYAAYSPPVAIPPKRSGCKIAAIILGVIAVVAIPVLGILAAIAIPAYNDYLVRAKINSAVIEARALQPQVEAFYANTDRCPRDAAELGVAPSTQEAIAELVVGEADTGMCMIELELSALAGDPELAGERIRMSRDVAGDWYCTSTMEKRTHLPMDCR